MLLKVFKVLVFLSEAVAHAECSKIGVLRNFAKFTVKHLCESFFFNKDVGLRPKTLLKKEALAQVFYCELCKISKDTLSYRTPPVVVSLLSTLGLLKVPCANKRTQNWEIPNIFGVCLTQWVRFKKWHMNVLVSWNAFNLFMASSIIWSFCQNAVKGNLEEF